MFETPIMKLTFLILLIATSQVVSAFEFQLKDPGEANSYRLNEYTIIEYPQAEEETFEFQHRNKSLFVKSGNNSSVFDTKNNQISVKLEDSNSDGLYDRIDYYQHDSKGRLTSWTSDRNFDGQPDFKMITTYQIEKAIPSSFVWINSQWHQIHENGRDTNGLIVRTITIDSEQFSINLKNFPFELSN